MFFGTWLHTVCRCVWFSWVTMRWKILVAALSLASLSLQLLSKLSEANTASLNMPKHLMIVLIISLSWFLFASTSQDSDQASAARIILSNHICYCSVHILTTVCVSQFQMWKLKEVLEHMVRTCSSRVKIWFMGIMLRLFQLYDLSRSISQRWHYQWFFADGVSHILFCMVTLLIRSQG